MTPATTIELDPQTAKALTDYAAALGLSVEDYLKRQFTGSNGPQTIDDADRWLDELAEGLDLSRCHVTSQRKTSIRTTIDVGIRRQRNLAAAPCSGIPHVCFPAPGMVQTARWSRAGALQSLDAIVGK